MLLKLTYRIKNKGKSAIDILEYNNRLQIWIIYSDGYYFTTEDSDLPSYFTDGSNYNALKELGYGNNIEIAPLQEKTITTCIYCPEIVKQELEAGLRAEFIAPFIGDLPLYGRYDLTEALASAAGNGNASATSSDGSGTDAGASAADASAAKTNATEEEVEQMLQESWDLGSEARFSFHDGVLTVSLDGANLSGSYYVDTDQQKVKGTATGTDGNVNFSLPYEVTGEDLILYNNAEHERTFTRVEGSADTETAAALSPEELESLISQQPVRVLDTEVTDGYDSRFLLDISTGIILPHVINEGGGDIKNLSVHVAGWDSDDLPVILKSSYMSYTPDYTAEILLEGVNLVEGATLNSYDADTYNVVTFNDTCGVAKAKAIVSSYTTFSGEKWENPLLNDWIAVYGGEKKLEKTVVYTDTEIVRKVQEALNAAGYDCGTPDGISGGKTESAIRDYQKANGLPETGTITDRLLDAMGI